MGQVLALSDLLDERRVWRGRPVAPPLSAQPTGHPHLDAALPFGGWPEHAWTAKGTTLVTLEDEKGNVQIIV